MKGDQGNTPEKDALQPGDATTRKNTAPRVFGAREARKPQGSMADDQRENLAPERGRHFARPIFGAREARSLEGIKAETREKIPLQHLTKPNVGKNIAFVVSFYGGRNLPSFQP